ncbi:MAG TPA: hypothetical protein PKJ97_01955 [Candidatus Bilamarchaeaceae archaeon]|nr:hypothetical protein [Candidatus Bilamarchaeaceae archaeon]
MPMVEQPPPEKKAQPARIAPIAKEERGKVAAQLNRVDIALDGYDDIFSDFDPSPFSTRLLSKDLIEEVTRRYRETKEGDIEVRFTVPGKRNKDEEAVIKARLKEYFLAQAGKVEEKLHGRKRTGVALLVAGLALVTFHKVMSELFGDGAVHGIYKWVENPVELFGWISTWVGADRIYLQKPEELIERKGMMGRFGKANFVFVSEEMVKKGVEAAGKQAEKKQG